MAIVLVPPARLGIVAIMLCMICSGGRTSLLITVSRLPKRLQGFVWQEADETETDKVTAYASVPFELFGRFPYLTRGEIR